MRAHQTGFQSLHIAIDWLQQPQIFNTNSICPFLSMFNEQFGAASSHTVAPPLTPGSLFGGQEEVLDV
jgi:hypothetical protein